MDVINSRVDYLGYYGAEAYGMSWKVYSKDTTLVSSRELYHRADVFGTISNSVFSQNYFGSYMFGGYCMGVTGSTWADNYYYGLDPHDDTDAMTVTGNAFARNGGHGFICSVYCSDLVVTDNRALNNGLHGLMIHRRTDGARIENNVSTGNGDTGIAIFDSYDAVVRGNYVENNGVAAIRFSVGSSHNLIEGNTFKGAPASSGSAGYVIYSFQGSDLPTEGGSRRISNNTIRNNGITASRAR
jgi:parallel beta-helix repeat protein